MLESTKIIEQKAKIEQELRTDKFLFLTGQEPDFAVIQGEMRAKLNQVSDLDDLYVKEIDKESQEAAASRAGGEGERESRMTAEFREFREVAKKVSLNDYLHAARDARPVSGAAAEYNTHVFGHNAAGDFPVEMLGERGKIDNLDARDWQDIIESEHRAAVTGTGVNPGSSTNYIQQLFGTSEAAFCGASFPAVGVGDHSYPIFSKSTTANNFARDAAEPESAGSLTINTATNVRLQSSMVLTSEDENRIPNIAGGLVAHLRAGLQETLDDYVITQLIAALVATDVDATGTTENLSRFLARVGGMVDGIGARNVGEVRGLLNTVPEAGATTSLFSLLSAASLGIWRLPLLGASEAVRPDRLQGFGAHYGRNRRRRSTGHLYPHRRGPEPWEATGPDLASRPNAPGHRCRPASRSNPVHGGNVRSG